MLYEYKSATGTVKIEVNEKWAEILSELDRQEKNNDHTETRRHSPLNTADGEWVSYEEEGIQRLFDEETDRVNRTLQQMKPAQKAILIDIYINNTTKKEYAEKLGITQGAVSQRLATAEKSFKKIFAKT